MRKIRRIEIDGNDGTGKSYFYSHLEAFLKKHAIDGIELHDRGYLSKATLLGDITDELYADCIQTNLCEDTLYIIVDDSPENCQKRILSRGDSIDQEFHNMKDLTYFRKQFKDIYSAYCKHKGNMHIVLIDRESNDVISDDNTLEKFLTDVFDELGVCHQETVAVAESCTGGNIAHKITLHKGSSAWFKGSVTTYTIDSKIEVLGVSCITISKFGVVSKEVAEEMANKVRTMFAADYGIATTGLAELEGDDRGVKGGTIWLAVSAEGETHSKVLNLNGSREENIETATKAAIELLDEKFDFKV